jgi:16S rRNA (adenine1518-N6/adenine1519-N6)-dimethyltransferase
MNNIKPKQSLGQNFLVDDNIARNIVRDLDIHPDDILIEIGPGKGSLTKHLVGKGKHLVAMEIDNRVVEELQAAYNSPGVTILHKDFLEASLPSLRRKFGQKLRLLGNIPYHLTSSILFKAFEAHAALTDITIMLQREVAQRIAAKPSTKEYGILAVLANFYGVPKIFFHVSPNCFYPKPKVESSVLRIVFHPKKLYQVDEKLFTLIVKTTFGKRRKTIRNGLQYLPYDDALLAEIAAMKSDLMEKRPEQLTVEQFAGMTQQIENILNRTSR